MTETALVLAVVLQAVIIGVLTIGLVYQCSASRKDRNFLLWRLRKTEQGLDDLDATVDEWISAGGVNSERKMR